MGKLIEATIAAGRLGITSGRLRALCRQRRIKGARFIGGRWYVPENADVVEGTRGPALTLSAARVVKRANAVIADIERTERLYEKVYGNRDVPLGAPATPKPRKGRKPAGR
jgi:hypothetical protein